MESFRFAYPEYLWGLMILPLLIVFFVFSRITRKKALKKFGNLKMMEYLMPFVSMSRPVLKFIILLFSLSSFILGLARPQFGSKLQKMKREGVEIMIALDVSNSMLAEDILPNRLERAKRAISSMIDRLSDDKIGLIIFAGDAYIQLPITNDYTSAKMFLNTISPEIVPKQGTAIGAAIDMATHSFTPSETSNKAIIIITDGENHEDDAVSFATEATKEGIIVHAIGMGLPQGTPIPVYRNGQKEFRTDRDGNTVVTRLNEQMLEQISAAGNGIYVRANNAQVGLNALFDEINKMEKTELESLTYSEYNDQFQYFFIIGLALLLIEFMILERKNKYLKNVKLFKEAK